jgi:hypothetical protein
MSLWGQPVKEEPPAKCNCIHENNTLCNNPAVTTYKHQTTDRFGRFVVGIIPLCADCDKDHRP